MTNIDRFNVCAAKLFATLYAAFPKTLDIDFHEWLGKDVFEPDDEEFELCDATLRWLAQAGYVNVGAFHTQGAARVTLSVKGLEILKAVPKAIKTRESLGDAIIRTLKAGALEAAKQLVGRALTEGFNQFHH